MRETIRIGEEGGLPTQVTHHKIIGAANWGKSVDTLRLVEEARARGVDVTIDQYPYTASSTGTAALFPQWSQAGGQKALLERLAAPDQRAKITAEIIQRIKMDRGGGDPKNVVMANCPFDTSLDGKSLADITAARGRPVKIENAAETAIEIQQKGRLPGGLSRHQRRRHRADLTFSLYDDRIGRRDPASSATARRIRAATGHFPACWRATFGIAKS